jgi:hypothetical protein
LGLKCRNNARRGLYTGFLIPGVSKPKNLNNNPERLMFLTIAQAKSNEKEEKKDENSKEPIKPEKKWCKVIVSLSFELKWLIRGNG